MNFLFRSCKDHVVGRACDHCMDGNWAFPHCVACQCDLRGTIPEICNQVSLSGINENCFGDSDVLEEDDLVLFDYFITSSLFIVESKEGPLTFVA